MNLYKARDLAVGAAAAPADEVVALELALFRVLSADITAATDFPAEYRSRWDGFALRSADTASACEEKPVTLNILPILVAAGGPASVEVRTGACFRITTGAVIPSGADAVVPIEDARTFVNGDEAGNSPDGEVVELRRPAKPGQGVLPPGADAFAGDLVLEKGDLLTPARLAAAAGTGIGAVPVYRRPRVAVLATGDELISIGGASGTGVLTRGAIFCNNVHLLDGLVRARGCEPVHLGIAPDDPDEIHSLIARVNADLVVTTGGMGRGSRDFIREVWKRIGVDILFDSLNISPGKASAFGCIGERCFLGLSGNPWASRVVFEEIATPVLRRMQGIKNLTPCIEAAAAGILENKKEFNQAIYGSLEIAAGSIGFVPEAKSASQAFLPFIRNHPAYAVLKPGPGRVLQGDVVEVKLPDLPLGGWTVLGLD